MKKLLFSILFFSTLFSLNAQLIISGVFDGNLPGGVPKVIELYVQTNIADLSIYGVESANNGATASGEEFTFPAVAAVAGEYISITVNNTDFNDFFGFDASFTSSVANNNGDDAIVLWRNGVQFDHFGNVGTDADAAGQTWDYDDGWAYTGDLARLPVVPFMQADWNFSGINAVDNCTTNATCANAFPSAANAVNTLPINLTKFTAQKVNNTIDIIWQTTTEINNDHFQLQHSTDGRNFQNLEKIAGAGNSTKTIDYTYTHLTPTTGVNFYRLEQVDYDGTATLSDIVSVQMTDKTGVSIYPTMATNELTIAFNELPTNTVTATIYNQTGQFISTQVLNNKSVTQTINIANLTNGMHIITLQYGQTNVTKRFVKL